MSIANVITRGYGNGTLSGEIRQIIARGFFDSAVAPIQVGNLPNIGLPYNTGTYTYETEVYFTGDTSFSISPSVPAGWSFSTSTGELIVATSSKSIFGPFTVTAINTSGSTPGNAFYVTVASSSARNVRGLNVRNGLGY